MSQDTPKEIILQIIEDMYTSGMTPPEILKEVNLGMSLRQLQRITKDMRVAPGVQLIRLKPYWEKESL